MGEECRNETALDKTGRNQKTDVEHGGNIFWNLNTSVRERESYVLWHIVLCSCVTCQVCLFRQCIPNRYGVIIFKHFEWGEVGWGGSKDIILQQPSLRSFPGSSDSKESACNAGDLGSIPGLGRFPGGGHSNPLHYSCLENPHGQRSQAGYCPVCEKSDATEWLSATLTLKDKEWWSKLYCCNILTQ